MIRQCVFTLILVIVMVAFISAGAPSSTSYQGILKDSGGNPVNGTVNITFTIYDDSVLSNPENMLWQETHLSVVIDNGLFMAILGKGTPAVPLTDAIFSGPDRWLGIRVQGGDEQSPRTKFLAQSYAHRVSTIDGATAGDIDGDLNVTGDIMATANGVDYFMVPRGAIIMWSGNQNDIPTGWKLCDGTGGTPDLRNRFIYGCDTGEPPGATGGSTIIPGHSHSVDIAAFNSGPPNHDWYGATAGVSRIADYNHFHSINPPETATSTTPDFNNLPPYYKLCFIMKL